MESEEKAAGEETPAADETAASSAPGNVPDEVSSPPLPQKKDEPTAKQRFMDRHNRIVGRYRKVILLLVATNVIVPLLVGFFMYYSYTEFEVRLTVSNETGQDIVDHVIVIDNLKGGIIEHVNIPANGFEEYNIRLTRGEHLLEHMVSRDTGAGTYIRIHVYGNTDASFIITE